MAEEKESTSIPLSQGGGGGGEDPEDPAKAPPNSPNSSTRKVGSPLFSRYLSSAVVIIGFLFSFRFIVGFRENRGTVKMERKLSKSVVNFFHRTGIRVLVLLTEVNFKVCFFIRAC